MEEQNSPQGRRATFWITFLGPVALGVVAGAIRLAIPWLTSDGAEVSPAQRMLIPVLAGLVVAVLMQVGRWWLYRRSSDQQGDGIRSLCAITILVVLFAAGLAALIDPGGLLMLLPLFLFAGFLRWWPRKKAVDSRQSNLGIYCVCILSFLVAAISVSMTLTPTA